jgi:hypothetical protein
MSTPRPATAPITERSSRRSAGPSRTALSIAILCAITLAFYHRLWLPDQILVKGDAFRLFLPMKQYMIERLSHIMLPQWFPYEAMGRPFIGVTETGVFHPFTALYFLFSVADAYRVSTLLACLLAALGAFALGRQLGFSHMGSLVAGIAFVLSGYVVSLTDNFLYLYSICTLPLFCAGLEKMLRGARWWAIAPAVVWAMVFWHGDIQTGYYYGFIALLWTAARAPGTYREAGLRLALAGGLTATLAGIQLGPAWAVFVGSARAQHALFYDEVMLLSTPPIRLLTMLAWPVGAELDPNVLGRSFFGNPEGIGWVESIYLGGPVLGLAVLGAWHYRDLRVLAWLGGVALLLSLGQFGGLYKLFYHAVPLWSVFRFPEKLMGVTTFSVAMLAGAGVEALRSRPCRATFWLAGALLCAGAGLGLSTEAAGRAVAASLGTPVPLAAVVTGSAAGAFFFSAVATLGVGIVLVGIKRGALRSRILFAILVAIIALDLTRANLRVYQTGPAEIATFVPPLAEAIQAREGPPVPGRFRLVSMTEHVVVWPKELMHSLGYYGAKSVERRQALDLEHNAQLHLETFHPYLPGYSTELTTISQATVEQGGAIEVAARFNVTYYIGRRYHVSDPRLAKTLLAELPEYDLALFRSPVQAKLRAYLSQRPERASSPVDPAALLVRRDFLNGEVDVIETADATLPGPAPGGSAVIEHYAPEDVRVQVEASQPAVLILLDAYDKGWTATLENGAEIPILRANVLARAVVVPAGAHAVTFRYETPLLKAGAGASLLGCMIGSAMIVFARRRTQGNVGRP